MGTIKEITSKLSTISDLSDPIWELLAEDERVGVQKAVKKRQKAILNEENELLRLEHMLRYEKELYKKNISLIAGIDEVGRGPLAGPVVAACVILPKGTKIIGLDDSKKIPKQRHLKIYQEIISKALDVGIGIISNEIIDQINIYEASKLAMVEAIKDMAMKPDYLLIDAMSLKIDIPQLSLIKGDANSLSIAAASVVAKVTRDKMMSEYELEFPGYGFSTNAGYGTKQHIEAINHRGVTSIHRKTFEPVKTVMKEK